MEKVKVESPPSDSKTASPASQSPPFPSSPTTEKQTQQFASNFTTLFHSIFPPKPSPLPSSTLPLSLTPSISSPSSSTSIMDDSSTEHRLQQARLILEYEELWDHFELSLARLQNLTIELESLRQENEDLRQANSELLKLLSLSSKAGIQNGIKKRESVADFIPNTVIEPNQFERKNGERVSLPKSISVRSSGYLKMNQAGATTGASNSNSTRSRIASQLDQLVSGSVS